MSVFATLNAVNVNEHTEKKNGLTYLSWAWAWQSVKSLFPEATYTIYENADGWFYHTDGKTAWVKTGVTIEGLEHIEYLPVMDYRNKSIPADLVTSFDVNKAIQRPLTKACARHGLGLYVYSGEDLPQSEKPTDEDRPKLIADIYNTMGKWGMDEEKVYKKTKISSVEELPTERLAGMLTWLNGLDDKKREELM